MKAHFDEDGYRERLKRLRKAFRLNQKQFAKRLGIQYKSWNHYECGHIMITLDTCTLLRHKVPGLSIDWLLFGDPDKIPKDLRDKIERVEEDERAALIEAARSERLLMLRLKKRRKAGSTATSSS